MSSIKIMPQKLTWQKTISEKIARAVAWMFVMSMFLLGCYTAVAWICRLK